MLSTTLVCAVLLAQKRGATHLPKWFDFMLAGYAFAYDDKHSSAAVYDPTNGFMLIREPECDGGDMTLLLTRDRHEVADMGFKVPRFAPAADKDEPMVEKRLPSLSTGKGIRIGQSPKSVASRLGRPSETSFSGSRNQYFNYTYKYTTGGDEATDYEETYTFRSGKLVEIVFTWEPNHDTDKAVIAPKAKRLKSDKSRD